MNLYLYENTGQRGLDELGHWVRKAFQGFSYLVQYLQDVLDSFAKKKPTVLLNNTTQAEFIHVKPPFFFKRTRDDVSRLKLWN
jgi:hypothetical protein